MTGQRIEQPDAKVPTLEVSGLTTRIVQRAGLLTAVDDVSFAIMPGEILGVVGESGSGKSMLAYSIMGLVDPPVEVAAGSIKLSRQELRGMPEKDLRRLRGDRIAMIFQDPMMTLNPVLRIDTQMVEAVLAHRSMSGRAARDLARDALSRVGIEPAAERLLSYPHQFSGGMRQRVAIAIALLNAPDLIICDEPTTALDVTTQAQILEQMQTLCRESGTALIWITHDLTAIAGLADRVAVMYAGRIVETGSTREVLEHPSHPYTHGLIASAPANNPRGQPLSEIGGMVPGLADLPSGCSFRNRCPRATEVCKTVPLLVTRDGRPGHLARCFHPYLDPELANE
ncbi:MAG: Oligopeptide/dipeptide transporter, ATP-binding protein-like protein [Herminiimonas sp.]|nr:Oligopeptide/dipeptide transporter, ATP-binding protein-like protein [Herminiimonas sp.]